LAISEFTKKETQTLFRIPAKKITTTLLGVGTEFKPFKPTAMETIGLRKKYKLPENFILFLGTLEPRKNLKQVLSAFAKIQPAYPQMSLVLAGNEGWQTEKLIAQLEESVVATGYIDQADKPALYNLATLFVFPSLYEGFGMPPLEAMACGIPTIVSNRASLPEVVGRGARIVRAERPEELAKTFRELLNSRVARENLSQAGRKRAQDFSWIKTAQQTLEALEQNV
jgi:glycosyltransferase involved in cell wall biosynthesis